LQDTVDFLVGKGHHVTVLTYGSKTNLKVRDFDSLQNYSIVRIEPSSGAGRSSLMMGVEAFRIIVREKIDRILCGVAYASAIIAYLVTRLLRVPFAVYSHGEDVTCVKGSRKKAVLLSRALRAATVVMTNSNFSLREVRALGVREEKSTWLPPGIDIAPYTGCKKEDVEDLRKRLQIPDGPLLLTVARLAPRKGQDTVIRSLPKIHKQFPDLHYLIVGGGDQAVLKALASETGVSDSVIFVDWVSDSDLPLLYHLCDIYVMVSRWDSETGEVEGFGMVYLEAGACEKPSIAGSAGGCGDAVENNVTGFVVDPESPEEVSEAVVKILSSSPLQQSMGKAGRERVERLFTKQTLLPRIERLLINSQPL